MSQKTNKKPHVLFLFSDTGGGHRSAAEAIIEAINLEYPDQITYEMVDFFKKYAPPPFDKAPETYPPMARIPDVWELGYAISDGRRRSRAIMNLLWPYVKGAALRLLEEHRCDLFLSVHPVINTPLLRTLGPYHPPYITVVTDMVSTHAFWYHRKSNLVVVPTESARDKAINYGIDPGRVIVAGLPVADRFATMNGNRAEIRARLGWPQDKPVVLLMGGGEGMGPVERTALSIADAHLDMTLVVVCGKNEGLKRRLEMVNWPMPTFIYGFVTEMPNFMQAADVLVTKAGPGTISEGFIAGLPIILFARMPGQEDGNVAYVVEEHAGVWAPRPQQVVDTLTTWITRPEERLKVAQTSRSLARPDASRKIARIIGSQLNMGGELKQSESLFSD
ncbi:MAG TPA: glycosyltransferase [Anaerolineaceae bacterium]|nr:glycosyltransferase [Anaerolineaceae bacterium]HPN52461.1 glycosyltransferase [Anaerolineaceae bacterium]